MDYKTDLNNVKIMEIPDGIINIYSKGPLRLSFREFDNNPAILHLIIKVKTRLERLDSA